MYTKRLINKRIEHFSTNEIFEIIEFSKDFEKIKLAKKELNNRNLNENELKSAKNDYENYKILRINRKEEVLTISEWFSFFLVFTKFTKKIFSPSDSFTDSELERFIIYGYETKLEQAIYARRLGMIFFYIIVPIWIFIILKWIN